MKADVLTSLTSPKGIGFDGTGGPTLRELTDQANWFKPGRVVGGTYVDGKVRWNLPKGDHQIRKAFWTSAECAMACQDLDERYFYALRYQFALDDSVFYSMKLNLLEYMLREKRLQRQRCESARMDIEAMKLSPIPNHEAMKRAQQRLKEYTRILWPDKVPTEEGTKKFLEDLVTMCLSEIRNPSKFARPEPKSPNRCQEYMLVTRDTWGRKLEPIYETLKDEYRKWIAIGIGHMNRRLRNEAA
jgi:hypothetical protein